MPTKYWILTKEFPPYFGGGIATYCAETCKTLKQNGVEVSVFIPSGGPETSAVESPLGAIIKYASKPGRGPSKVLGSTAANSFTAAEAIIQQIKTSGAPDYIEVHDYNGLGYHLLHRKLALEPCLQNTHISVTMHSPQFALEPIEHKSQYRFPQWWTNEMERFCIAAADSLLSPSQWLVDQLTHDPNLWPSGIDRAENIQVVRNPYSSKGDLVSGSVRREFVFVGRIQKLKGVFELIETFAKMWDSGFDIPLRLIGGDAKTYPKGQSTTEVLRKKYRKYMLADLLRFDGNTPPRILPHVIGRPLAVITASLFENFPYVVVENMDKGQVVIASSCGGQSEIIQDGANGFLFNHGDPQSLPKALMAAANLSGEDRDSIGRNARESVKRECDPQTVFEQKMKFLESVRNHKRESYPFVRIGSYDARATQKTPGKLTVVVPFYNLGATLNETINSIAQSTYKDLQVVIVNDGSTDPESIAALEKVQKRYFGRLDLEVATTANQGLPMARNTGAAKAVGQYLCFVDADDTVQPDYFAKAVAVMERYRNIHFVGCWLKYFGARGPDAHWPAWTPEPPYILYHNSLNTAGLVFRTESFCEVLNDPEMLYGMEDYETVIGMVSRGMGGIALQEPLFNYRVRVDSMMHSWTEDTSLYLADLIARKHKHLYARYMTDLLGFLQANGPGTKRDNPSI